MQPGHIYHIYNHANGRENLFVEEKNYQFFLEKLSEYILPVCSLYAYCLMPNHFHLVAGVKNETDLQNIFQGENKKVLFSQKELESKVSKAFSNMFSSYTQSFNKVYSRKGSLFIPSMKTELIETDASFCKVVHYTHTNPVHHGFVKKMDDWNHSSIKILKSHLPTKIDRNYVLNIFGGQAGFNKYHEQPIDIKRKWIDE